MEGRVEQAIELHKQGYNCAQAVVCAYCDLFAVDHETACRMSEGFGLGMGIMEVCGALSGAFMLAGLKNSGGTAAPGKTKAATYKLTKDIAADFRARNQSLLCRELKGVETGTVLRTCPGCIEDACRLVETYLLGQD